MSNKNEKNNFESLKINAYTFNCVKTKLLNTDDTFVLDNRILSENYFTKNVEIDLEDGEVRRCVAENGAIVIRLLERIPTFDSSDRIYDSYKSLLIFKHNNEVVGLFIRGGYCLACVELCTELVPADEKTSRMILELLKAPMDKNVN